MKRRTKSSLLRSCGVLGWVGCTAALATHIIGVIVVKGHNPISETISQLAVGKYAWIQDLGLDLLAVAFLACGVGMLVLRTGGFRWRSVAAMSILMGVDMVVIAEHNQYAGQGNFGGTVHSYATIALWVLFVLAALLLAPDLGAIRRRLRWTSVAAGVLWIPLPPLFLYMARHATGWDGLLERFLALVLLGWVAMLAWVLFVRAADTTGPERRSFPAAAH